MPSCCFQRATTSRAFLKSGLVSLPQREGVKWRMTCSELHGGGREFTWVLCPEEIEERHRWERRDPSGDSGKSQGGDECGPAQEAVRDTLILENPRCMAVQVGRGAVQKGGKPLEPHSEGPDAAKGLEGSASLDAWPTVPCHIPGYAQSVDIRQWAGLGHRDGPALPRAKTGQVGPQWSPPCNILRPRRMVKLVPMHALDAGVSMAMGTQRPQSQKPALPRPYMENLLVPPRD